MTDHEKYMYRSLGLAQLAAGYVAPNPMVGAVLVHNDQLIAEGWHQRCGEAHAEVNCIEQAIRNNKAELLTESNLYVNLEPCAHFGKTPPCADLIIKHRIPRVIVGTRDPFKEVNGKGIEKLKEAGVDVVTGVLEMECKEINRRFLTFHTLHRPYIILKWAETADGFMASEANGLTGERLRISDEYTNRLVHKWRSEEAAILIGTRTALLDNPELTTRLWPGPSPVRLVVDLQLKLPHSLKVFDGSSKTIVFNLIKNGEERNVLFYQVTNDVNLVHQMVNALYRLQITSVLVEGGAKLLQSFMDAGYWDEIRRIGSRSLKIEKGLPAPRPHGHIKADELILENDLVEIFRPQGSHPT